MDLNKLSFEELKAEIEKMNKQKEEHTNKEMVIVRTYSAGVFFGYIQKREGKEVTMTDARRVWKWSGAATLSQLAMEGTTDPENCKFPCAVNQVLLLEVIEILQVTDAAKKSLEAVEVWKQ